MTVLLQLVVPPELAGPTGVSKQSAKSSYTKSSSCSKDQGSLMYVETYLNDSESWLTFPGVTCLYTEIEWSL